VRTRRTSTGRRWTPNLRQLGARYILLSTAPRYDYSRQLTSNFMVVDPLSPQVIRRLGNLLGHSGEDVLGESTSYIFKFYLFLALLHNFNSLLHGGQFLFGGWR
jgi:hypothetical protein